MKNKQLFRVIIAHSLYYFTKIDNQLRENGFQYFGSEEYDIYYERTKNSLRIVIDVYCVWLLEEN